jgi:hypothetical protein
MFFVAFVVVCAYTLLNLYVGVIFNQFSRIRTLSQTGSAFLTQKQQVSSGRCNCACGKTAGRQRASGCALAGLVESMH